VRHREHVRGRRVSRDAPSRSSSTSTSITFRSRGRRGSWRSTAWSSCRRRSGVTGACRRSPAACCSRRRPTNHQPGALSTLRQARSIHDGPAISAASRIPRPRPRPTTRDAEERREGRARGASRPKRALAVRAAARAVVVARVRAIARAVIVVVALATALVATTRHHAHDGIRRGTCPADHCSSRSKPQTHVFCTLLRAQQRPAVAQQGRTCGTNRAVLLVT